MERKHTQKGITLIALIITIIVLLILAAVAIGAIQNDGIINYAKNARTEYVAAGVNENALLDEYLAELDGANSNKKGDWTQTGTVITNAKTKQTINVGDYVNYVSGVDGYTDANGWQVLGEENGEILLISADNVGTVTLEGKDDCVNYESKLAAVYSNFGKGTYASGVRSIKVEDIDKITGYSPEKTGDGTKFLAGTINEYGKTFTYTLTDDGYIAYTDGGEISDKSTYTIFIHPDGRTLASDTAWNGLSPEAKAGLTRTTNPIKVTNNAYLYDPSTLTIDLDNLQPGAFASDNEVFKMLFGSNYATKEAAGTTGTLAKSVYTGETPYWLASAYEMGDVGYAAFGMFCVYEGLVYGDYDLWYSYDSASSVSIGVRPVVSLESNVTLTSDGDGSWALPATQN